MNVAGFAALLREAMGLNAASIGNSAIERAVLARIAICKVDAQQYYELITNSAAELQSLVEAVVVPETWFFRDREAFNVLASCALEQWLPAHPQGQLRLLSLPCSTGEEPYSMAIALRQAGLPPNRYRIDAVDISTAALSHAQRADYGRNSFRGADLEFRERYFAPSAQGYRLDPALRQQVTFHHGNLFSVDALPGIGDYDFIFCRNLLIYFDRIRQNHAIRLLGDLLRPGGVLFVGPSESGLMFDNGFTSLRKRLAFAFRTTEPRRDAPNTALRATPASLPATQRINAKKSAPSIRGRRSAAQSASSSRRVHQGPQPQLAAALEAASLLADRGELAAAKQACQGLLLRHADSVEVLHLTGLLHAAEGDLLAATQLYRKALYLDPVHHDTLMHLGLLLEKQGDLAGARLLRARMRRLRAESEVS